MFYVHCFVLLDRNKMIKKRDIKVNSALDQSLRLDFSSPFVFLGSECHSWIDVFVPPRRASVLRLLANLGSTFVPDLSSLWKARETHG